MTYTARFWFCFLMTLGTWLAIAAVAIYTLGDIYEHRWPRR